MIRARIQAHPSRADLHGPLVSQLAPIPTQVMLHSSDPPNPWEGYKSCLRDIPDCSHLLVLQDDAMPCANFVPALEQIAERHPDTPVCLFMGILPASTAALARRAMAVDRRYASLSTSPFMPLVAVLWPRRKAQEFLRWAESSRGMTRADDGNASKWLRYTKQTVLVSVPSLVEHNDWIDTTKGGRKATWGRDRSRVALFLAADGLDYIW